MTAIRADVGPGRVRALTLAGTRAHGPAFAAALASLAVVMMRQVPDADERLAGIGVDLAEWDLRRTD